MKENKQVFKIGIRHVEAFLLFFLLTIGIGMRVHLAIALVAMTDRSSSPNPDVPVYDWDNTGSILSSFLWGYCVLQTASGNLGRLYGTKYILMVTMGINSIFHCLIPLMSNLLGSYGVIMCRCCQGLTQGFFYTSIYNLLSQWVPKNEKSLIASMIFTGAYFGPIITTPIVGYISSTWYGWPLSFYIYGVAGFAWVVCYYFFGADSPDKHPFISIEEKEYILRNLEPQKEKVKIPFKQILTNVPFWTIGICQIAQTFCYQTLTAEMPTFMNKVLKFNINTDGLLSALPPIVSVIIMLICGYLSDTIINKNILTVVRSRKLFQLIGSVFPASAFITLALIPNDAITLSVTMLVLTCTHSITVVGASLSLLDITPTFVGLLYGMVNSVACFVSIYGPLSVQFAINDLADKSQWRNFMLIGSALYLIPTLFYLYFVSAEIQPFDPARKEETLKKDRVKKQSVVSIISP